MAMEVKIKITGLDYAYATGASKAEPTHTLRKYSDDIDDGNSNNNGRSHNHIGKGYNINNKNHNVVDILDLAVPQSKVRPIDRLLDRYDWSSASMTPLLRDFDRPQRMQYDQPLSRPGRPAPPPPRRPPPPPPPPTRLCASKFSDRKRPVRKSIWKRAKELVSSFFVRASGPKVNYIWSRQ